MDKQYITLKVKMFEPEEFIDKYCTICQSWHGKNHDYGKSTCQKCISVALGKENKWLGVDLANGKDFTNIKSEF